MHRGGGVRRLSFITYVDIEARADEGRWYEVYLTFRSQAFALDATQEEVRKKLFAHMHYMGR